MINSDRARYLCVPIAPKKSTALAEHKKGFRKGVYRHLFQGRVQPESNKKSVVVAFHHFHPKIHDDLLGFSDFKDALKYRIASGVAKDIGLTRIDKCTGQYLARSGDPGLWRVN